MFPEIPEPQLNTSDGDKLNQINAKEYSDILNGLIKSPVWLSVSEAAKLGGVQGKTIRRAIKANTVRFKITGNRYLIDFSSLIKFLHSSTKLKNKLNDFGIGQYVDNWKK